MKDPGILAPNPTERLVPELAARGRFASDVRRVSARRGRFRRNRAPTAARKIKPRGLRAGLGAGGIENHRTRCSPRGNRRKVGFARGYPLVCQVPDKFPSNYSLRAAGPTDSSATSAPRVLLPPFTLGNLAAKVKRMRNSAPSSTENDASASGACPVTQTRASGHPVRRDRILGGDPRRCSQKRRSFRADNCSLLESVAGSRYRFIGSA